LLWLSAAQRCQQDPQEPAMYFTYTYTYRTTWYVYRPVSYRIYWSSCC
jgi:hypothetical protein